MTEYGYDIRGNQYAMTNAMGHTWNFRYDLVDQLTASVDPEGKATEAVYDLVGNITSITKTGARTTTSLMMKTTTPSACLTPRATSMITAMTKITD